MAGKGVSQLRLDTGQIIDHAAAGGFQLTRRFGVPDNANHTSQPRRHLTRGRRSQSRRSPSRVPGCLQFGAGTLARRSLVGRGGQAPHGIVVAGGQLGIAGDTLRLGLLTIDQSVGGPDRTLVESGKIMGRIEKIGLFRRQRRLVAVDEGPPDNEPAEIAAPPGLGDGVGRRDLAGAFQCRDLGIQLTKLGAELIGLFTSPDRPGIKPRKLAFESRDGALVRHFRLDQLIQCAVPQRQTRDLSGDSLLESPQSGLAFGQGLLDRTARLGLRDGGMENRRISRCTDGFELRFQLAGLGPAPGKLVGRGICSGTQLALFRDQGTDIGKDRPGRNRFHGTFDRQVGAEPAQQVECLLTELAKFAVPLGQVGTLIANSAALLVQGLDIASARENRSRHGQPGQFGFQALDDRRASLGIA
jgi:hypothetical protein